MRTLPSIVALARLGIPLLLCLTAALPAMAQSPLPLRLDGSVTAFLAAPGRAAGCGLRVFGIESMPPPRSTLRTVDLSVLLGPEAFVQGVGMVKASSFETTAAAMKAGQPTRPFTVTDGWLRVPGVAQTRAAPGASLAPDESPQVHRYLADAAALFAVLDAVLEGRAIEVSIERSGLPSHPVYAGVVQLAPQDRTQFVACMRDLQQQAQARKR